MTKRSFRVLRPLKRKKKNAARDSLIEAVKRLLTQYHPSEITTSMVLSEASVARGTLYLHFDDFSDLMETVLLSAFSKSVEQNINASQTLVDKSRSKKSLIEGIEKLTKSSQGPERRDFRFARLRLIAYSEKNPRFAKALAEEQTRLNEKFDVAFKALQRKGWLNKSLDVQSVAIFVQAYTLGRIIDDVADKKISPESWNKLIGLILSKVIIDN
jgi:AcrR family transcriptional regulator